jgi:hypothetical protein
MPGLSRVRLKHSSIVANADMPIASSAMSAFGGKADTEGTRRNVRF